MDDITMGGPEEMVAADVVKVKAEIHPLGFVLNEKKCGTITTDDHTVEISLQQYTHHTSLSSTLLGAPPLQEPATNDYLQKRCSDM